ncbi:unnamed protein product [marine sediment metagenome]|uniref:Uncharacterized protein n=1 Tax=marine sediment metagenome TaxID=412755 RepID=X1P9M6_9ZZZZ
MDIGDDPDSSEVFKARCGSRRQQPNGGQGTPSPDYTPPNITPIARKAR